MTPQFFRRQFNVQVNQNGNQYQPKSWKKALSESKAETKVLSPS
jgi:hypothetical protein